MTYQEALSYIHSFGRRGWVLGLGRVSRLLARVGNPQKRCAFVHIAGTNGKGSLAQLSGNLLACAGYRVGKYTSPYVLDFRERFVVDGKMISEAELARWTARLRPVVEGLEREGVFLTEFEVITALAFCWFAAQKCDVVCLEVGLGGRFDATNVIDPPLACLIGSISLDHTAILGDTVEKIAREKAGILKPGTICIAYPEMNPKAAEVLRAEAEAVGCAYLQPDSGQVKLCSQDESGSRFLLGGREYFVSLAGRHQCLHAQMILALARLLQQKGYRIPPEAVTSALANTRFPGRFQLLSRRPKILADGAHNPEAVAGLVETVSRLPQKKRLAVGMLADKAAEENLRLLSAASDTLFCLPVQNPRALPAQKLAELARRYFAHVYAFDDLEAGLSAAAEGLGEEELLLICGSFFLVGEILQKRRDKPAADEPL